jgi:hypothetical protein
VLKLRKLPNNINFNYKRSEDPINTLWQADNDFINLHQHKIGITTYFKKFEAMKKIVEELNQSANGHTVVDILYREHTIRKFRARGYLGGVFARPLALSTSSHCHFIVEKQYNYCDNHLK